MDSPPQARKFLRSHPSECSPKRCFRGFGMLFQTICKGFPITLRVQNLKNFPPPAVNLQLRIPPLNKFLETIRGVFLYGGVFLAGIPLMVAWFVLWKLKKLVVLANSTSVASILVLQAWRPCLVAPMHRRHGRLPYPFAAFAELLNPSATRTSVQQT